MFKNVADRANGASSIGPGASSGGGGGAPAPRMPRPTSSMPQSATGGYSIRDQLMHRGVPGQSNMTDPRTGIRMSGQEAANRGPVTLGGWNTSGVGPGTRGYRGSYYNGGYNGGAGTGRPSARNSAEYYAQRDQAVGNPLDNLFWNGPRGQNLMQSLIKEAQGGASKAPASMGGAAADGAAPAPNAAEDWVGGLGEEEGVIAESEMPAPQATPPSPFGASAPTSMFAEMAGMAQPNVGGFDTSKPLETTAWDMLMRGLVKGMNSTTAFQNGPAVAVPQNRVWRAEHALENIMESDALKAASNPFSFLVKGTGPNKAVNRGLNKINDWLFKPY